LNIFSENLSKIDKITICNAMSYFLDHFVRQNTGWYLSDRWGKKIVTEMDISLEGRMFYSEINWINETSQLNETKDKTQ